MISDIEAAEVKLQVSKGTLLNINQDQIFGKYWKMCAFEITQAIKNSRLVVASKSFKHRRELYEKIYINV